MVSLSNHNDSMCWLSTGKAITSLIDFTSPVDEYRTAFNDRTQLFINYYSFQDGQPQKRSLTRGEFWDLACSAALCLNDRGLSKGDRLIHCFSSNNPYDLVFRLAAALTGCVPVTINWQTDSDETIAYKARVTDGKLFICDSTFANRVERIKSELLPIPSMETKEVEKRQVTAPLGYLPVSYDDECMVIFTSGTTGKPKGVSLSHRAYLANRLTFEQYFGIPKSAELDLLVVNPLHHANSSALSDWAMRHSGAILHLLEHYTTAYWKILADTVSNKRHLLIAPIVSRHIDFLESLATDSRLPIEEEELKQALSQTDILIGSAPVGPNTIRRALKFSSRLPHVRFGSTETCLQVMATPTTMSQSELMKAFQAGWSHRYKDGDLVGYYIGREHFPFTRVKLVKAIDPESRDYFCPCETGEPGYLVTQGANVMSGYVGDAEATKAVFREGWYSGLRDIAFALRNEKDGDLDYYWVSRDSALLIRGGTNYSYDQITAELSRFVVEHFRLRPEQFRLAMVGLRLESEHEDSSCVTIELSEDAAYIEPQLNKDFIEKAAEVVSKGARPDYVRFGRIPRNFKGEILYGQLEQDFLDWLKCKSCVTLRKENEH